MKNLLLNLFAAMLIAFLAGCGPKSSEHAEGDGHGHEETQGEGEDGHGHGGEEVAGASYAEGKGITLIDETSKAIGLELVEAEERKLAPIVPLEAQVYRAASESSRTGGEQAGFAYATALLNPAIAEKLKGGDPAELNTHDVRYEATVWRIDPVSKEAVNSVEAILQIPDPQNTLAVGEFVSGSVREAGAEETVLTVPRSAVLTTATGKFAYVQNGGHLLRSPITVGAENAEYAEITDGIYAGDVVAANPVETLYLIELRATKGGGHSH